MLFMVAFFFFFFFLLISFDFVLVVIPSCLHYSPSRTASSLCMCSLILCQYGY